MAPENRDRNAPETDDADAAHLRRAIALAREHMDAGGPFGAVVVRDGEVVGEGWNRVTSDRDPTAHAEIVAIRAACERLGRFSLDGCVIHAGCEPCPMCLAAIYWARLDRLVYGAGREDAARAGFDDALIHDEIRLPRAARRLASRQMLGEEARAVLRAWAEKPDKVPY